MILMVPIIEGWAETYENNAISSDADRILYHGSNDHVRFYGADFSITSGIFRTFRIDGFFIH